jgi:hypothetical protein
MLNHHKSLVHASSRPQPRPNSLQREAWWVDFPFDWLRFTIAAYCAGYTGVLPQDWEAAKASRVACSKAPKITLWLNQLATV